jgi:hypothetical protein
MLRRFIALLLAMVAPATIALAESSHAKYFDHYEGTKTCLMCHRKQAETFFYSQHYQWQGKAPQIVNSNGKLLGKMNTINDFCTNPVANWIKDVKNSHGDEISSGCSECHAGLGLLPSQKISEQQLLNIDCLECHAAGYRRELYEKSDGTLARRPILWQNQEGMDSVAKRISLPTRVMCLRCHSSSGGGANFKRGDLEYKLANPDRAYDVHMGTDGANMQCIACHGGEDHRVLGRGTDLSGTDSPGKTTSCDTAECHGSAPHSNAVLNRHAARVYCSTCHIPTFARTDATDMVRDWSKPVYNKESDKYLANITLASDVKPVYAWYNGLTWEQLPGQSIRRMKDGSVGMMLPEGSRSDSKARIYAFKLHKAKLPVLEGKDWIIPIEVENFFAKGDIDTAVKSAAEKMYGVHNARYSWVPTTRYMGIFHGVLPATQALQCIDCHGPNGRMNWKELGYKTNPNPMPAPVASHK